jgi:hypothetical protein
MWPPRPRNRWKLLALPSASSDFSLTQQTELASVLRDTRQFCLLGWGWLRLGGYLVGDRFHRRSGHPPCPPALVMDLESPEPLAAFELLVAINVIGRAARAPVIAAAAIILRTFMNWPLSVADLLSGNYSLLDYAVKV